MAKNKKKDEKKPFIKTKTKADNSVEVTVTKSPAKTTTGKILVWVICAFTIFVPVVSLILAIILMSK